MPDNSLRRFLVRWAPAAVVVLLVLSIISDIGGAWQSWQEAVKWLAGKLSPAFNKFFEGNETSVTVTTFAVAVLLVAILAAVLQRVVVGAPGRGRGGSKRRGERGQTTRQWYLDYLREDVLNRRKASIHFARYIDIGLSESLHATMPLNFVAYDFFIYSTAEVKQYASFEEAFEDYRRRILLLGHPGSGKTTTLHNLALALIDEAESDPSAPVPLLLNLSKFGGVQEKGLLSRLSPFSRRGGRDADGSRAFDRWLVQMLNEMPVEGIKNVSRQWVEGGRVALLLDGLDEVNEANVKELVRLMNESYLREHPQQTVVVCSRIFEYQPLMEQKDTRLALQGSATLKPLNREQINAYLEHAEATALRDALFDHEDLYEMAESPLTLSMMTLAYGGKAPLDVPRQQPFLERRRWLLDTYVTRMVQRNARRLAGVPFDLNPDNDVPPRYTPDQINHYLGWLAIKLSERMRTLLPLGRLHTFLSINPSDVLSPNPSDVRPGLFTAANVATMIVGALVSLSTIAALLYRPGVGFEGTSPLLALSLLAPAAFLLRRAMDEPTYPAAGNAFTAGLQITALVIGVGGFMLFAFGLLNASFIRVMPVATHPAVATAIITPLLFAGLLILGADDFGDAKKEMGKVVPTMVPCLVVGGLAAFLLTRRADYVPLGLAAGGVLFFFVYTRGENNNVRFPAFSLNFIWMAATLICLGWGLTGLVAEPGVGTLAAAASLAVGYILPEEEASGVAVLFAATLVLCHLLGYLPHGVLASFCVVILGVRLLSEQSHRLAEKLLLNPALEFILLARGDICPRYRAFLRHAADSLLLKRAGAEYEFVHRLLRDHFAIRELIPALFNASGDDQLRIINQLSRQGDSGFDALSGLITFPDSRVRTAAVQGLGRIGIPKVLAVFRRILAEDSDADVRAAVMRSLERFPVADHADILKLGAADASPKVRAATMSALRKVYTYDDGAGEARQVSKELTEGGLRDDSDEVFHAAIVSVRRLDLESALENAVAEQIVRVRAALKAPWPSVRRAAAFFIGMSGDKEFLQDLVDALRDQDAAVRAAAAAGLSHMRSPAAIMPLLAVTSDADARVRSASVKSIGDIAALSLAPDEERSVKQVLLKALSDKASPVRSAAAMALRHVPGEDIVVQLGRALRDRERDVQIAALFSLRALKDARAAASLLKALKDRPLREAAAKALAELREPSVYATLRSWLARGNNNQRAAAIITLTLSGVTGIVPTLQELLKKPPRRYAKPLLDFFAPDAIDLRAYAAVALGRLGGPLGETGLLETLLDVPQYESEQTRAARIIGLTYFPPDAVAAALETMKMRASGMALHYLDDIARSLITSPATGPMRYRRSWHLSYDFLDDYFPEDSSFFTSYSPADDLTRASAFAPEVFR